MSKTLALALAVLVFTAQPATIPGSRWDRPATGDKFMVASGHELATEAGLELLRAGGNAFDAGVGASMALNVTRPISAGMVGVAPTLIYSAAEGRVRGYNGLGTAPAKGTPAYYRLQGWPFMPIMGMNSQLLPASPDQWIAVLSDYGTMSFGQVAQPAIRLAENGHPLNRTTAAIMQIPAWQKALMKWRWTYNYEIFWKPFEPDGPKPGDILVQKDLARTLRLMVKAEADELARSGDRRKALAAARWTFYEGEIADGIVKMQERRNGIITRDDLKNYRGYWEEPPHGSFMGYDIWSNNTWCQGPTVPMIMQMLANVDLKALGRNTPEYLSAIAQAVELAYADREAYFGDPLFVDVPIKGLLSKEYAAERAKLIHPRKAFGKMPPAGDPWKYEGRPRPKSVFKQNPPTPSAALRHIPTLARDTTYLCVIDAAGNGYSMTPSDFPWSPMVDGYGIMLGNRVQQFHLVPGHPAAPAPGKRPRLTPNPSLVTKDGKLFMTIGTPGGDMQPQGIVQVMLNIFVWGMDPQAAINAPRIRSRNFPDSFSPHEYNPGSLEVEYALRGLTPALTKLGYKVGVLPEGSMTPGAVCAIIRDAATGKLTGGADPREEAVAKGE